MLLLITEKYMKQTLICFNCICKYEAGGKK